MAAAMREHIATFGGGPNGRLWHIVAGVPLPDALMTITQLLVLLSRSDEPLSAVLDRDVPPGVNARCAAFDHASGMRAAAEHLIALGHRNFALIAGGPARPARERRAAVEDALAAVRDNARCSVYSGEFSVEHGRKATEEILASVPRPTAIIAGGNMLMQGALLALRDANVVVGRDVSFVGCDDVVIAELHQPPIAVVRRDISAIGVAAAELLLGELEPVDGETAPEASEIVFPTEFVARASCAPPPRLDGESRGKNRFRYGSRT